MRFQDRWITSSLLLCGLWFLLNVNRNRIDHHSWTFFQWRWTGHHRRLFLGVRKISGCADGLYLFFRRRIHVFSETLEQACNASFLEHLICGSFFFLFELCLFLDLMLTLPFIISRFLWNKRCIKRVAYVRQWLVHYWLTVFIMLILLIIMCSNSHLLLHLILFFFSESLNALLCS